LEKIKKLGKYRNIILVLMDIFCIALAYYLGVVIITDTVFKLEPYYVKRLTQTILVSGIVYQIVFHITKRYKNIKRYETGKDYLIYFFSCMASSIIISIVRKMFHIFMLERTKLILLSGVIISLMMISYRIIIRYILVNDIVNKERKKIFDRMKSLRLQGYSYPQIEKLMGCSRYINFSFVLSFFFDSSGGIIPERGLDYHSFLELLQNLEGKIIEKYSKSFLASFWQGDEAEREIADGIVGDSAANKVALKRLNFDNLINGKI